MTRLSSGALCSKWLSPRKRFFGVFPEQFFTFVSQSPAIFWASRCCFRKILWRVPPTSLYICLPNGCCFIKVFWRVPPTALYIYLPVSSWGQSCVNCWHVSPMQIQSAENDPSCWGILWAYYMHSALSMLSASSLLQPLQPIEQWPKPDWLGYIDDCITQFFREYDSPL